MPATGDLCWPFVAVSKERTQPEETVLRFIVWVTWLTGWVVGGGTESRPLISRTRDTLELLPSGM